MKHFLSILGWAVVMLAGIFFILKFAFSDYLDIFMGDSSILETKPWRPVSRVIFGGIVLPIYLAFAGWFIKALFRDSSGRRVGHLPSERRISERVKPAGEVMIQEKKPRWKNNGASLH